MKRRISAEVGGRHHSDEASEAKCWKREEGELTTTLSGIESDDDDDICVTINAHQPKVITCHFLEYFDRDSFGPQSCSSFSNHYNSSVALKYPSGQNNTQPRWVRVNTIPRANAMQPFALSWFARWVADNETKTWTDRLNDMIEVNPFSDFHTFYKDLNCNYNRFAVAEVAYFKSANGDHVVSLGVITLGRTNGKLKALSVVTFHLNIKDNRSRKLLGDFNAFLENPPAVVFIYAVENCNRQLKDFYLANQYAVLEIFENIPVYNLIKHFKLNQPAHLIRSRISICPTRDHGESQFCVYCNLTQTFRRFFCKNSGLVIRTDPAITPMRENVKLPIKSISLVDCGAHVHVVNPYQLPNQKYVSQTIDANVQPSAAKKRLAPEGWNHPMQYKVRIVNLKNK